MNQRPTHGDGHTPTSQLQPLRCPCCENDLELTCPNRCANAHEGAHVGLTAAQRTLPPRASEKPKSKGRKNGGTRHACLEILRMRGPLRTREAARATGIAPGTVQAMLLKLAKEGAVCAVLPRGCKIGAVYSVAVSNHLLEDRA